ncbi:MAG: hypothetical protein WBE18_08100 [Gammaproteobacteria bacterium]
MPNNDIDIHRKILKAAKEDDLTSLKKIYEEFQNNEAKKAKWLKRIFYESIENGYNPLHLAVFGGLL